MNHRLLALAMLGSLGFLSSSGWAAPKTFYVGDPVGRDVVRFTSDAPLELISGQTSQVQGKIVYDDQFVFDPKHPFSITFDVNLDSLDTGIGMRNDHMRNDYLMTEKYPKATFKVMNLRTTDKPPFKSGQRVKMMAEGMLTVRGKSVRQSVSIAVTYWPESNMTRQRFNAGDLIRIQARFPVSLKQHGIPVPAIANQKLAETVYVDIDAFGTSNPDALKTMKE